MSKIWKYKNYDEYKTEQIKRRDSQKKKVKSFKYYRKLTRPLVNIINRMDITDVICQGVRNDNEVLCMKRIFKKAAVYGTDIAYENKKLNIFRLDFSKCPQEWEKKFDILFSNSIDHSYLGEEILKEWIRITRKYMIIQFSSASPRPSDPFSVDSNKEIESICNDFNLDIIHLENLCLIARIDKSHEDINNNV